MMQIRFPADQGPNKTHARIVALNVTRVLHVQHLDMRLTPPTLWHAMQAARQGKI